MADTERAAGFGGHCPILAASIAIGLIFANFVAGNLQSSIDAVGRGQMEAGHRYARFQIPGSGHHEGDFCRGYVAVQDLTLATQVIRGSTGMHLLPLLITTLIYFLLAWLLNKLLDYILFRISQI